LIACDLGSNTLRAVEISCDTLERVREFERIVKTAEGVESDGKISEAAVNRVIAAVLACREEFDLSNGYRAVTTAALRYAKNGEEVAERIYAETGVRFEIIDGEQEAELTQIGVENRLRKLGIPDDDYLLLDLGGGSSEVVIKKGAKVIRRSFSVGIVTLVEKYGMSQIEAGIVEACRPIRDFAKSLNLKPARFVGSSGTPTTIAAFVQGIDYAHYDYRKINGYTLDLDTMGRALEELLAFPPQERERWVGVGREDLIIAGVKLLMEIAASFGFDRIVVVDDGLREGVGILACQS